MNIFNKLAFKVAFITITPFILNITSAQITQECKEKYPQVLSVSGESEVSIPVVQAKIQVGLEARALTAMQTQKILSQKSNQLMPYLNEVGATEIENSTINLNAEYHYNVQPHKLVGFQAQTTVTFKIPVQKAGELMDKVVEKGATRIDHIEFMAQKEELKKAQNQAISLAAKEAQKQAQMVLDSLGLKMKKIAQININNMYQPAPQHRGEMMMMKAMVADAAPMQVQANDQKVRASVQLTVHYE